MCTVVVSRCTGWYTLSCSWKKPVRKQRKEERGRDSQGDMSQARDELNF